MPKFKVLEGAAEEIYGTDIRPGDVLTLTKAQAEHLITKGQIEPVTDDAPAEPAPVETAIEALTLEQTDDAKPAGKGSAGGRRD